MSDRLLNAAFKVPGDDSGCEFELFTNGSNWYLVFSGYEQNNDQFTSKQIQAIDDYVRDRLTP